ncbi:ABC transporter substrate-binding protein [Ferroacidibacillus organovorans]|uniref:Fe/B12 periplasmic-binding domain-containing protein n=1 Tax=Ferroacidibacillus organovorans TaxID=1765683 RepID=A0A853KBW8_9BACL|nr:ABC transporter substrate-binding protein [Ferroacidibacillus organovorans]KYP79486.1 hypothetical protein AYJ22_04250 [Ferroacidibacillus organovorans]OAG94536.1 hypothetical protein AYW79_04975 [Ferroacidibacillus organovorans]
MVPERIVCLAAEVPEILDVLGVLDRVVGISAYTTRPSEALSIPKVSGFKNGSIDRILRDKPDLVILTSGVQKDLASELAQRGVTLLHFNPHRLTDMFQSILLLGNIVGQPEKAERYCAQLKSEIDVVKKKAAEFPFHPRVYFEEWMDPVIVGTGWISDLIEIAGGEDIFREISVHGRSAVERIISPEQILERDPEIVFASWCGNPFQSNEFLTRAGFTTMRALREERIYEISSEVLQCGPMLVDQLRVMHDLLQTFVDSSNGVIRRSS